jgi:hypothetical protein
MPVGNAREGGAYLVVGNKSCGRMNACHQVIQQATNNLLMACLCLIAFAFGMPFGVRSTSIPVPATTLAKEAPYLLSLSRIRYRRGSVLLRKPDNTRLAFQR